MEQPMHLDDWKQDLHDVCGHYYGVGMPNQQYVKGRVVARQFNGLDVADVSSNIDCIQRDRSGIKKDQSEHVFCVFQMFGRMDVTHNGNRVSLRPGDAVLVDSTKEAVMAFEGRKNRAISVHMPRQIFLATCTSEIRTGVLMGHEHPMSKPIRQQIKRFTLASDVCQKTMQASSDLFLGMIGLAFSYSENTDMDYCQNSTLHRFGLAMQLIETNLLNDNLSIQWLAVQMNLSIRQVQRVFRDERQSFVKVVRTRRLQMAADRLKLASLSERQLKISEVAYAVGFRDLSNFNRGFKAQFGIAPRDYCANL